MRFYICDFDSSFGAERCGMVVKTGLASCAKRRVGTGDTGGPCGGKAPEGWVGGD